MSDVYKVAVALTLQNNLSAGLAIISKELAGVHGKIKGIEDGFGAWGGKLRIVAGILAAGAIVDGLVKIAQHGEKLLDQQDKLQRAGLGYADVLALQSDYYSKIAKAVPTSTASEYLKTVNELRAVTGNTAEAASLAPKALMVDTLLSNTMGREVHGEYYKLLRSAEMKGISTDPKKLEQFTDQIFSYIVAFGGKLTANDFQTMARRGGTAFMNAKPEAMGPLAVLAADLHGDAAGTALMTLQQLQTGANTLSKQQASVLSNLGLLDMSKTTKTGFGGSRLQLQPGAIVGSLDHVGDLPGWVRDTVYPALVKASHGDEGLLQNLIAKISPNRNAAKLIEMFGNPKFLDQQQKDLGLAAQVESIPDAYKHFTERNPVGVKTAFHDQYESMLQAMGAPLMAAALPGMKAVTELFTTIGGFANRNAGTVTSVIGVMKEIGKILYRIDSFAIEKIGAITGISSVFSTFGNLPWETIRSGLASVNGGLSQLGSLTPSLDGIKNAISSFVDAIAALYRRLIGSLGGALPQSQTMPNADRHWSPSQELGAGMSPVRFVPGGSEDDQPHRGRPGEPRGGSVRPTVSFSLNIDGRKLAEAVMDNLVFPFDTTAPAFNGATSYGA